MMEVSHITMVNWHSFVVEDIVMSGHASVLGANASGKSTILDLAQVVLAGASGRYMRLNAVAGEGGKGTGSKRSVHGYCLGALGEGEFRREDCLTYITVGFRDTRGIKPPVTIGLAMEAHKSQPSEIILSRMVVRGRLLTSKDFLRTRDGVQHFAQWEEVRQALVKEFGADFVNHRDSPTDYVREYMRDLVPNLAPTAQNAGALVKAIVNGMTLNQGLSATDFVRRYILEDAPMKIADLRESLRTYRQVNQAIKDMQERAARLRVVKARAEEYGRHLNLLADEEWITKKARFLAASSATRSLEEEIKEASAYIAAEDERVAELKENKAEAQADVNRITGKIASFHARTRVEELRRSAKNYKETADSMKAGAETRIHFIRDVGQLVVQIFPDHGPAKEALRLTGLLPEYYAARSFEELEAAEKHFLELMPALEEKLDEARADADVEISQLSAERATLEAALGASRSGAPDAHLGEDTRSLMAHLRNGGMNPRAFCDIVDVTDPRWRQAAEGLLGRDREAIFVDRADIGRATEILRQNRRTLRRASLVSLNKLEQYRDPAAPGTFPSLFSSDDLDALAFLQRRYGNVRLADTIKEFDLPGRALMSDGLYDDGLVRGTRLEEASRLMIGKAAQSMLLVEWKSRLDEVEDELAELAKVKKILNGAISSAGAIRGNGDLVKDLIEVSERFLSMYQHDIERVQSVDMSEVEPLKEKLRAQQAYVDRIDSELNAISSRFGSYRERIDKANRILSSLTSHEGTRHSRNVAKTLFQKTWKLTDWRAANRSYRGRIGDMEKDETRSAFFSALAGKHRKIEENARAGVDRYSKLVQELEGKVRAAMRTYFEVAPLSTQVGVESAILPEILPWAEVLIRDIEENELTRHQALAEEASAKVSSMFRGEFVNALHSRVSKLDRDMASLNHSLRNHTFHGEKYSFRKTAIAEYSPILKAVEIYMTSEDALELLFKGEISDDSPHKAVLDEVKRILEDPETRFEDFEDYRNFFVFEIHMENLETGHKTRWETRRGVGSGAEQQVPLYVAIGASLAALYGTSDSRSGFRVGMAPAIFDEVFAKLDGGNQRQMMSFYEELGLQVIVAAPPEKRDALIGYMHTVVEVDKIGGGQSMTTCITIKERTRKEIVAINPDLTKHAAAEPIKAAAE
jgi:energy-coupling factor transporter ATP-binding protein EcfA2